MELEDIYKRFSDEGELLSQLLNTMKDKNVVTEEHLTNLHTILQNKTSIEDKEKLPNKEDFYPFLNNLVENDKLTIELSKKIASTSNIFGYIYGKKILGLQLEGESLANHYITRKLLLLSDSFILTAINANPALLNFSAISNKNYNKSYKLMEWLVIYERWLLVEEIAQLHKDSAGDKDYIHALYRIVSQFKSIPQKSDSFSEIRYKNDLRLSAGVALIQADANLSYASDLYLNKQAIIYAAILNDEEIFLAILDKDPSQLLVVIDMLKFIATANPNFLKLLYKAIDKCSGLVDIDFNKLLGLSFQSLFSTQESSEFIFNLLDKGIQPNFSNEQVNKMDFWLLKSVVSLVQSSEKENEIISLLLEEPNLIHAIFQYDWIAIAIAKIHKKSSLSEYFIDIAKKIDKEDKIIELFKSSYIVQNLIENNLFVSYANELSSDKFWQHLITSFTNKAFYMDQASSKPALIFNKNNLIVQLSQVKKSYAKLNFIIEMLKNKDSIFWYQRGLTIPRITKGTLIQLFDHLSDEIVDMTSKQFVSVITTLGELIDTHTDHIKKNNKAKKAAVNIYEVLSKFTIDDNNLNEDHDKQAIKNMLKSFNDKLKELGCKIKKDNGNLSNAAGIGQSFWQPKQPDNPNSSANINYNNVEDNQQNRLYPL